MITNKNIKNNKMYSSILRREIYSQPQVLEKIISSEKSNILKIAAKILTEIAKLTDEPEVTYDNYEHAAELYREIGNEKESKKTMNLAYQNYISAAKKIRNDTKKITDIEIAEQRLNLASKYALRGKNEKLSNNCWIDLGDKIREVGLNTDDPAEAP